MSYIDTFQSQLEVFISQVRMDKTLLDAARGSLNHTKEEQAQAVKFLEQLKASIEAKKQELKTLCDGREQEQANKAAELVAKANDLTKKLDAVHSERETISRLKGELEAQKRDLTAKQEELNKKLAHIRTIAA